ncbi:MAG: T9SS type A sorting domain-containing protein [Planctomycetes bacterium]|nr:T9SS type A sorting domain-containing protein [Planctomycetota bacterium]
MNPHPWLVRHLTYPTHERLRGRNTLRELRELARLAEQPLEVVRAECARRLRELLIFARRELPYFETLFERCGVDPRRDDPYAELMKLRVLQKADVRKNAEQMVYRGVRGGPIPHSSGGTTGDTLHFDTSLLAGQTRTLWGKEQIPPPGVPWPNRNLSQRVGWGLIEGTNVGLVTVTSWSFDAQFDIRARFEQAVDQLMRVHNADGIIFDFRFNTGGGSLAREGLELLFNETVPTVGFDQRIPGSSDHFAMEPDPLRREANLVIRGNPATFFDKPIAILIGPGSISAGELEARRLSFHPNARIFGLPAPGGNTGSDFISIGDSDWFVSRAHSTQYLVSTHAYLTHLGLEPDERVWFTREDAANGVDTVIKAALDWIEAEATAVEDEIVSTTSLDVAWYPNPFRERATVSFELDAPAQVSVTLYDLLGRRVATLMNGPAATGPHQVAWEGKNLHGTALSSGLYFWKVTAGSKTETGAVMLVR